jgi:thioesterase domain-containing protein/acyl carrier protein
MSKPKIEAIYPLTFMQQALLLHSLYEPEDQGFLQVQCILKGRLDRNLLQKAWGEAIHRHQALRTSVHWEKIQKPVQIVHPAATLPWTIQDWRHFSKAQQEEKLEAFKNEERARGLNLTTAPVSRMALFQLQDDEDCLLWSCHHILLDGWSAAIILRDVFTFYEAGYQGREARLESLPSYKSYLSLLQGQDLQKAESFWKQALTGFKGTSSREAVSASGNGAASYTKDHSFSLSTERTQQLIGFTRQHRITLNTLVQGVWTIILSRYHHTHDVAFGTTVSGRSAALPNMEQMAGLFMNVLPVRVQIEPDRPFSEWLQDLQKRQLEARNFEFVNMDQILDWIQWPGRLPLFDSLLVVENFPWNDLRAGEIEVRDFAGGITSTYPLTVIVKPGSQLEFQIRYDQRRISQKTVSWISKQLTLLLNSPDLPTASSPAEMIGRIEKPPDTIDLKKAKRKLPQDGDRSEYVAPQRDIELQLTKIWEEIFGRHTIGVTENFFEIGGSSLLAVRLFARIEQKFGRNLPPSVLLQHPTIRDLARLLQEEDGRGAWSALVPIRASGSRLPLFCIHAGGAHVFFYNAMAHHLGPDQPVYAMQPVGLDGTAAYAGSIEEMATHYLEEIRAVQPEGPYALLGTCFSNAVCFEMAKQLQKAGQSVSLLAIVDSAVVDLALAPSPISQPGRGRWRRFVGRLQQAPLAAAKKMLWARATRLRIAIEKRLHFLKSRQAKNLLKMQKHLIKLYLAYKWVPFQGKITLIRSEEFHEQSSLDYHITQWSDMALDGLDVFVAPGKHDDLFEEPEVQFLAKQLRQCLDAVADEQREQSYRL